MRDGMPPERWQHSVTEDRYFPLGNEYVNNEARTFVRAYTVIARSEATWQSR